MILRKFISYYKPHIGVFTIDMIAALFVAASSLFYPMIARNIINVYVYEDTPKNLILWSAILLGIYLFKMLCNYIVGYYGHVVGVKMQADMRRDLFYKYEGLPTQYFDDHKTGDLLTRLVSDLFDVSELAHHGPEDLFLSVLMLVGSFFVLFSINPKLTLIMFAIIPFIILVTVLSRKSMVRAMDNSHKQMSVINAEAENSITGIRETKAYVAEAHERQKFDAANKRYAGFRTVAMKALGTYHALMTFLTDLLYLAIVFIGGLFLYRGELDAGDFAAFMLYISLFLNPIQRFVSLFEQLQEGLTGFRRFYEIMQIPEEVDEGKIELTDVRGDVCFDHVSFGYRVGDDGNKRLIINDLSLNIRAGETLALVGASGGGKTTLCNLIPRFYPIDAGRITIDGIDTRDVTLRSLRKNIGIVSQNIFLFDGTVRDNIAYGAEGVTDEQIVDAAKRANIHDFVMSLDKGYDTEVGERGVKLSGGQKQRVAIARVFLKNPTLLILDEATSALDNVTEMQIQSALDELSRGRTVIVVAHRLSTVKGADEIAVIDRTGILERGTHEELLAKDGAYKTLYSYQFKSGTIA